MQKRPTSTALRTRWIHGERHATHKQQTRKHASYLQGKQFPRLKPGFKHDRKNQEVPLQRRISKSKWRRRESVYQMALAREFRPSFENEADHHPPSSDRTRIPTGVAGQESSRTATGRRRIGPENSAAAKKRRGRGRSENCCGG